MKTLTINGIAELFKLAKEFKLNQHELLRGSRIQLSSLSDPHAVISSEQELRVINNLYNHLQIGHLGLIIGDRFPLSILGLLGTAVPNAASLKEAIEFFLRYIDLSYTYFDVELVKKDDGATIHFSDNSTFHFSNNSTMRHLKRFFVDRDIMFTIKALRDILGRDFVDKNTRIKLGYSAPNELKDYTKYLGSNLEFKEGASEIHLTNTLLNHPLPQSNPLTLAVLEEQCEQIRQRIDSHEEYVDKVKHIIRANMQNTPSLESIAEQLFMSSRNLRRKLEIEGEPFHDILRKIKYEEAQHLLRLTKLSVEDIAHKLGYSESASFNHAFKRWSGKTPSQYRRSQTINLRPPN